MLGELEDTAAWLTERVGVRRDLAMLTGVRSDRAQTLRDEAARLEGRAMILRMAATKARGA